MKVLKQGLLRRLNGIWVRHKYLWFAEAITPTSQILEPSFRHELPESRVHGCTYQYYIAFNKIEYKNQ